MDGWEKTFEKASPLRIARICAARGADKRTQLVALLRGSLACSMPLSEMISRDPSGTTLSWQCSFSLVQQTQYMSPWACVTVSYFPVWLSITFLERGQNTHTHTTHTQHTHIVLAVSLQYWNLQQENHKHHTLYLYFFTAV